MTAPEDTSPVILFVDDEAATTKYFQRAIGTLAPVITAGSVEEGKRVLDAHAETLLILVSDQRMPGEYGNELLRYAKERYPHIIRILATAYSELDNTVEAINEGQIHRYLKKPLDITALRIELKQVLEYAYLRKERDQLVREKMIVQHTQIVAHRMGVLQALCASLSSPETTNPLESYLRTAHSIGLTAPSANWTLMDYSDLVGAEARRNGELGFLVKENLKALSSTANVAAESAFDQIAAQLGDKIKRTGPTSIQLVDQRFFVEFLETPVSHTVSNEHAKWIAFLIWLSQFERALQVIEVNDGIECRICNQDEAHTATPLSTWIEQF